MACDYVKLEEFSVIIIIITIIELFGLLCLYAMPPTGLGVGSVNNPCMGLSVRCQDPTDIAYGRGKVPSIRAIYADVHDDEAN